jgi:hypothetical protein
MRQHFEHALACVTIVLLVLWSACPTPLSGASLQNTKGGAEAGGCNTTGLQDKMCEAKIHPAMQLLNAVFSR